MQFKRFFATVALSACLLPGIASAQIILNAQGQAQLAQLATQLVSILNQLSQAQGQGSIYTSSAAFDAQAAVWTAQLTQIQTQLVALLSERSQAQLPPQSSGTIYTTNNCPRLSRNLSTGDQGSDVYALQQFLAGDIYAQYNGSLSGIFDYTTQIAVQKFQTGYAVVANGTPDTTGYGRVGTATRAAIAGICGRSTITTTVAPITVPTTGPLSPGYVPPSPSSSPNSTIGNSTGQLTILANLTGQSGGPNSIGFSVNMQPNSTCSARSYTLTFGDGAQQVLSAPASCGNQVQTVTHVYPNTGTYNATLASGTFQTSIVVNVTPPNNSLTLSAVGGAASYSMILTSYYNPGTTCVPGQYTLAFGDGATQSLSYTSGCSTQSQVINHVYPQAGQYLIAASDAFGHAITTNFTSVVVTSAGAGDPFGVLSIHAEGTNGSTSIVDASQWHRALTIGGNARIDTSTSALGDSSISLDGSSHVSAAASNDFNYDSGPFTIDLWFAARTFPAANGQVALMMQAGSSAADASLGGAGLELFGNKLYFVGKIGGVVYHPFYNNTSHSQSLVANTWYHAAAVRSGNSVVLYLNGLSQGTTTVSGAANASSNVFSIGRYGEFNGDYFNGWIDEVDVAKGTARWSANFIPSGFTPITAGPLPIVTDGTWLMSLAPATGWQNAQFDDSSWGTPTDEGGVGAFPWNSGTWVSYFPAGSSARWLWHRVSNSDSGTGGPDAGQTAYFRKTFSTTQTNATLYISADNSYTAYLNGSVVASGDGGRAALSLTLDPNTEYTLAISVSNSTGPAGLLVDVR